MTDGKRRGPRLIEDGLDQLPPAPAGAAVAPDIDALPSGTATAAITRIGAGRSTGRLAQVFWAALIALLTMGLGLWFWDTVEALIARNVWLGRIALGLLALLAATLVIMVLKEAASLARLSKIDALRAATGHARASRDRQAAQKAVASIERLYKGRPELSGTGAILQTQTADIIDGDAIIDIAERHLMTPLDIRAEAAIRRGARDVAAATALIPLALIDVLSVLALNLRMIRQIAEIYGGRAGWLGSWRLLRAIASHLVTAGAMAVGEDILGPALGGGVLSKLSRRFGEGVVNGALTARIGVAAMEVCRPMAFHSRKSPNILELVKGTLGNQVFGRDATPPKESGSLKS